MKVEGGKFYQKTWFLWFMLIILPPIGIILIWTVHKDYSKNKKIVFSVVFALWTIICLGFGNAKDSIPVASEATAQSAENHLLNAELKIGDVMNGFKTEKLGNYAWIEVTKAELKNTTAEQLLEFANNKVKESGYNWVSIVCEDGTGIQFPGSMVQIATYGDMDSEGCITSSIGDIILSSGTYEYSE